MRVYFGIQHRFPTETQTKRRVTVVNKTKIALAHKSLSTAHTLNERRRSCCAMLFRYALPHFWMFFYSIIKLKDKKQNSAAVFITCISHDAGRAIVSNRFIILAWSRKKVKFCAYVRGMLVVLYQIVWLDVKIEAWQIMRLNSIFRTLKSQSNYDGNGPFRKKISLFFCNNSFP